MLDNKEDEVSFENVQSLFQLLIGTFKMEARFLYQEVA